MKAALLCLCLVESTSALAQRQHPIDKAFAACTAAYQQRPAYGGAPAAGRHCEAEAVQAWKAELARLVAKVPSERAAQVAWEAQQAQQLAHLQATYTIPGVGVSTTGTDEIRWYLIESTRKRVWQLTTLAKEPPFALPND